MESPAVAVPDFSVVITCLNEERSIDEFARRLLGTIRALPQSFDVVFVDDGSEDGTYERILGIFQREPLVSAALRLFRNSGQAAAITAGLSVARGRNFVLLDSDLQLEPEELPLLLAKFAEGHDVVSGYRVNRRDSLRRRFYSKIANGIMRRASGAALRDFGCTFKVFDGRLVRAFELGPHHVFHLVELLSQAGRWADVPVTHHERRFGRSGWTLRRLLDLNTDNLIALTKRPFQYVAVLAGLGGLLLAARVLLDILHPVRILPQVSAGLLLNAILVSMLVGASIQALIGELVIRSFASLRGTPAYVVKEAVFRHRASGEGHAQGMVTQP